MIDYIISALLEITDQCAYTLHCENCAYSDDNGKCKLSGIPADWNIREWLEEEAKDDEP